MKLDYYGFYIGKIYYEYKKKYRIVEIDISGEIHYALQKKLIFGWQTICYYMREDWAVDDLNKINQRKKTKINKIIKGD